MGSRVEGITQTCGVPDPFGRWRGGAIVKVQRIVLQGLAHDGWRDVRELDPQEYATPISLVLLYECERAGFRDGRTVRRVTRELK